MAYCTVPFCKSDQKKKSVDSYGRLISFHQFPSDLELRNKWILAVRRKGNYFNMESTVNALVCCLNYFSVSLRLLKIYILYITS